MHIKEVRREVKRSKMFVDVTKVFPQDEHAQRLARLEFENEQRKDMNAAFLKLEEAKEGLQKFIREE